MGRWVTPRGVVLEVNDEAARNVGYKPAPVKVESAPKKKAPAKKTAASEKSDN